jgi:hypothetical protein
MRHWHWQQRCLTPLPDAKAAENKFKDKPRTQVDLEEMRSDVTNCHRVRDPNGIGREDHN